MTLRSKDRDLEQRFTQEHAKEVLAAASKILQDMAEIGFTLGTCETVVETMPNDATTVSDEGFYYLVSRHGPGPGVRILCVDMVERDEVGGQSREKTRVCMIKYRKDIGMISRMLAHEFGHLLGLEHPDRPKDSGPGNEKAMLAWTQNLMSPGALNPNPLLTPAQVKAARASSLASRFGG